MKHSVALIGILLTACSSLNQPPAEQLAVGKLIAFDRNQGNCLACHQIADGDMPGNIGPALTREVLHQHNKQHLHDLIWDAARFNPKTSMPPYGKNKVLSNNDIRAIVDYLWSLP